MTFILGFVTIGPNLEDNDSDSLSESPSSSSSYLSSRSPVGTIAHARARADVLFGDSLGLSRKVLSTSSLFTTSIFLLFSGEEAFFSAITFCLAVDGVEY